MFTLSWSKKKKKKIYQSKIPNSNQASVCIHVSQSKGLAQLGLGEVTESLFRGEGASGRLWESRTEDVQEVHTPTAFSPPRKIIK